MGDGVYLSRQEQVTFWVIEDYRAGKLGRSEAAAILGVSEKTVSRKAKAVREKGIEGIKHRNTGRTPVNKVDERLRQQVLKLIRSNYFDFNIAHIRDALRERHAIKISYGTLHKWCRQEGLGASKKRRASKPRIMRERMANEGLLLQMDGSHHKWNQKDTWCLIAMIDDATSDIPYAEFFAGETTKACMKVLRKVIEKRGIPDIIYTDEAGWADRSGKRRQFSQFKRVCEELGIRLITTRSPQAKGRIERAWRTFQGRLVPELRLEGIQSMTAANQYLQQVFIPRYWSKLKVEPRSPTTRYKPVPAGLNLDHIFCLKYERVVASDHSVQFGSDRYKIVDQRFGSLRQQIVTVHLYEDGTVEVFHGHIKLRTQKITLPQRQWLKQPA